MNSSGATFILCLSKCNKSSHSRHIGFRVYIFNHSQQQTKLGKVRQGSERVIKCFSFPEEQEHGFLYKQKENITVYLSHVTNGHTFALSPYKSFSRIFACQETNSCPHHSPPINNSLTIKVVHLFPSPNSGTQSTPVALLGH